jgi:hypothetical protein
MISKEAGDELLLLRTDDRRDGFRPDARTPRGSTGVRARLAVRAASAQASVPRPSVPYPCPRKARLAGKRLAEAPNRPSFGHGGSADCLQARMAALVPRGAGRRRRRVAGTARRSPLVGGPSPHVRRSRVRDVRLAHRRSSRECPRKARRVRVRSLIRARNARSECSFECGRGERHEREKRRFAGISEREGTSANDQAEFCKLEVADSIGFRLVCEAASTPSKNYPAAGLTHLN